MPTNNIILKKVWQDADIIELSIECSSNVIWAITQVYVQIAHLQEFYDGLTTFLARDSQRFSWISGEFGDNTTTCTQFSFSYRDSLGHIIIEVTMEIDDGESPSKHTCCFFVYTELGALMSFWNQLALLIKDGSLGTSAFLFDS